MSKLTEMLDRLERLEREATPGPWEPCGCRFSIVTSYLNPQENLDICDTAVADAMPNEQATRNNYFISEFRNSCPTLVQMLREAVGALTFYAKTHTDDCLYSSVDPCSCRIGGPAKKALARLDALAAKEGKNG